MMLPPHVGEYLPHSKIAESVTPPLPSTPPTPVLDATLKPAQSRRPSIPKIAVPTIPKLQRIGMPTVNVVRKNAPKRSLTPAVKSRGERSASRSITPQMNRISRNSPLVPRAEAKISSLLHGSKSAVLLGNESMNSDAQAHMASRSTTLNRSTSSTSIKSNPSRSPIQPSDRYHSRSGLSTAPPKQVARSTFGSASRNATPSRSLTPSRIVAPNLAGSSVRISACRNGPVLRTPLPARFAPAPRSTFGKAPRNVTPAVRKTGMAKTSKPTESVSQMSSAPKDYGAGRSPTKPPSAALEAPKLTHVVLTAEALKSAAEVREDQPPHNRLDEFLSTIDHCEKNFLQPGGGLDPNPTLVMRLLQENADIREHAKGLENEVLNMRRAQFTLEEINRNLQMVVKGRDQELLLMRQQMELLQQELRCQAQVEKSAQAGFGMEDAFDEVAHKNKIEEAHAHHLTCLMESVVEFTNKQTSLLGVAVEAVNVL